MNELLVTGPPEAVVLGDLSQESDDYLSTVLILLWKVNLVTEDDEPLFWLLGSQDDALLGLLVLTVLVECLEDEVWLGSTREVDEHHLHITQHLKSSHESHGLARARRSTEQEWPVLREPRAQHLLMPRRVYRIDHSAGISHFRRLNRHFGHSLLPQVPRLVIHSDLIVQKALRARRGLDTGEVLKLIREASPCLQAHRASDTPDSGKDDPLLHVVLDLSELKREVGMVLVILNHIRDASPNQSKHRLEAPDWSELHHMVHLLRRLDGQGHETGLLTVIKHGFNGLDALLSSHAYFALLLLLLRSLIIWVSCWLLISSNAIIVVLD